MIVCIALLTLVALNSCGAAVLNPNPVNGSANGSFFNLKRTLTREVKERSRLTVNFHAEELKPYDLIKHDRMIMTKVCTNEGNGYNSTTGVFTAPVSGKYVFTATTGPQHNNTWAGVRIFNGYASTHGTMSKKLATVRAKEHVYKGHTVWLMAWNTAVYWTGAVSQFSGFLVSQDP